MKQWMYTTLIIVVAVVLAVFSLTFVFGLNPFEFVFNSVVWLISVVGVLFMAPFFLGYFTPWIIRYFDDKADDRRNVASGWHWLIAPAVSIFVGSFVMVVIVPALCKLPQLNTWAWSVIRFPMAYETNAWGWFAVVASMYVIGYFVYWAVRDFEN